MMKRDEHSKHEVKNGQHQAAEKKSEEAVKNQPDANNPPVETEPDTVTLSRREYDDIQARFRDHEDSKDKMLRVAADFENAKKRLMREREEFLKFSQERLILDLIPLLDNFERALLHAGECQDSTTKNLISGVQLVLKQLNDILKNQGLVRLETVGKPFDPHIHEAVGYVHEEGKEDEIVDETEAGYMLHNRLLRAAKVRVRMPVPPTAKSKDKEEELT